LFLWFIIGGGVDAVFAALARDYLYNQFRALAAVYQREQSGIFAQIGRALGSMRR
jgi:hypothetical protein